MRAKKKVSSIRFVEDGELTFATADNLVSHEPVSDERLGNSSREIVDVVL